MNAMSDSINELATALAKAQAEIKHAKKTELNPFFKSKYAPLDAVLDACKDALTKNGLAVSQLLCEESGVPCLNTVLIHSSGQFLSSKMRLNPVKNDPQGLGSAITYARRYALAAIVGVATEDDDGNAATVNVKPEFEIKKISTEQALSLEQLLKAGKIEKDEFLKKISVEKIEDLAANRFEGAKAWILARGAK